MARLLKVRRGEIYWADLDPTQGHVQAGRRPVLILSQDVFNDRSKMVIAVALTSQEPSVGFPLTLKLSEETNLPKQSWVRISQIRTLSVQRLEELIGEAIPEDLEAVIEGLYEIIGT